MYQPMPMQYGMMWDKEGLQKSLELIKEAVSGEREDELFYDYLISVAPTREEKKIIASIRDDEKKHNMMFRRIYKDITGMDVEVMEEETFEKPSSYLEGIKRALFGELKAVEKYRVIRQGLPNRYYRDMLFEIITDELRHASLYNYLYTENRMKMTRSIDNSDDSNESFDSSVLLNSIMPVVSNVIDEIDGAELERLAKDFGISNVIGKVRDFLGEISKKVEEWERSNETKFFKKPKR
ncbi:ferritin-like domain-containing protein [Clostridium sp. ZS2-4]|uniref:ferritin-like domain-containing protein n=1 Tax=Clostridium sp. ZS2-4 TaxID=2987703 RepID=UPI00227A08FF|nr:ferritin-like domain-containing protein [Clostridium sp. ZS2-4]MCY6354908.1 ferritin-like domain-containing protein [Clostridium sp. ZS2-4]